MEEAKPWFQGENSPGGLAEEEGSISGNGLGVLTTSRNKGKRKAELEEL